MSDVQVDNTLPGDQPIEIPPPPLVHVQARVSDGLVLGYGYMPAGSLDPAIVIVDLYDPVEAEKLQQPGEKYIDFETNVITIVPVSQKVKLAEVQQQRLVGEATAQAELLALENTDYLVILKASGGIA